MTTLKNSVRLIGFLETEPEFEEVKKRVRFSLATTDSYYDANGKKTEICQWHNIVATGEAGDSVFEYLTKGSEITLEGRLTYHRFVDDQGNERFITEIIANDILVLENKV
jgi:single-strand DNA-binding protein